MNRLSFALALLLACAPALAASPSAADMAAAEARMAEARAVAERGDDATAMRLIGEAARLAQNGEVKNAESASDRAGVAAVGRP